MTKQNQILFCGLGDSVAKIVTQEGSPQIAYAFPRLHILTPACTEDNTHAPAESVEIYGLKNLTALRDLLNQAIAIAHKGTSAEPVVDAMKQIQPTAP